MIDIVKWMKAGAGCLALLVVAGCGANYELAPVTGQVICQEKPVPGGRVTFSPVAESGTMPAPAAFGTIDENGKFELYTNGKPGAMVGKHRVTVTLPSGQDVKALEEQVKSLSQRVESGNVGEESKAELEEMKVELELAKKMAKFPCRAADTREATVNAGDNNIEIELSVGEDD